MITRADYLSHPATAEAHRAYYSQFVTEYTQYVVRMFIGEDALHQSRDPDGAFNDIPLIIWDRITASIRQNAAPLLRDAGDHWSLGAGVCILKEAARQIVESSPRD